MNSPEWERGQGQNQQKGFQEKSDTKSFGKCGKKKCLA
jgi:hypothetical protein